MLIISPTSGVEESGIYSIGIEIRSEDDNSAEPFTGSINKECFSISIMVAEKENECLLSSAEVTGLLLSSFDFLGKNINTVTHITAAVIISPNIVVFLLYDII
jgi:hypothetical protein